MTALEAMACGKPVVGTNAGGLGHLLKKAGAIAVKPGDAKALGSALIRVLQSESLQVETGLAGRQLAVKEFSWGAVSDRLESVYHRVLRGWQASTQMQPQPQQ
jgi:glycosyltransferase involved in cell wall biosynthesis